MAKIHVLFLGLCILPWATIGSATELYRLEPKTQEGLEYGKAVIVRSESTPEGHFYYIENLNMLIPVSVTLVAKNPTDDIRLALTKLGWAKPEREGSTGKDGFVNFRFRTQGEFKIAVSAEGEAKPYQLVAWVGDEVKPEFAPVVVKQSEYRASAAERRSGSESRLSPRLLGWMTCLVVAGLLAALVLWRGRI